jgi:hypothetical protein
MNWYLFGDGGGRASGEHVQCEVFFSSSPARAIRECMSDHERVRRSAPLDDHVSILLERTVAAWTHFSS